ncbi:MAG: ATP-binding protein [Bacteroidales bacterium]|nr:ATP-binding protein [Bacteroidales bacterium]
MFVEYYCRPIISTTNLPFTRWEEVLKDKGLCSALVDRMSHKSFFVNITGTSYRVKEKICQQQVMYNKFFIPL